MINSNELRIGSIIDFDGMKSIVKEIDNQGVVVFIKETDETEWIDLFQFTPITLTEEILLKCGFNGNLQLTDAVEDALDLFYVLKDKVMRLETDYCCYVSFYHIKHLHQLQNLYFALTGKELEINL